MQTTAVTINKSKRLDFPSCTKKNPRPNDNPERATKPIIIPAIAQISIISTAAFPAEIKDFKNNFRSSLEPSYLKNNEIMMNDKTATRAAVSGRKLN
jgi:hypothetical protein